MKKALHDLYALTIKLGLKVPSKDFAELREEWNRVMNKVEKELK
jgi:hypothetical protein